jgi:hypothetical protein
MKHIGAIIEASRDDVWKVFKTVRKEPVSIMSIFGDSGLPIARTINALMHLEEDGLIVPCETSGEALAWRLNDVPA